MTNVPAHPEPPFLKNINSSVRARNSVEKRLLLEYGAVFATRAEPPDRIVFKDKADTARFQKLIEKRTLVLSNVEITLQVKAADALMEAAAAAAVRGLSITPRGPDAAARSYADTVSLWASRVEPALDHWTEQRRITGQEAGRIRSLSPFEQVAEVVELEEKGIFFAKDLSKSILYSVAPPGASQHLSLLALDVAEFNDAAVRALLAQFGWYRTVISDLPHFTYLGMAEEELEMAGLKKADSNGEPFWVPDI